MFRSFFRERQYFFKKFLVMDKNVLEYYNHLTLALNFYNYFLCLNL